MAVKQLNFVGLVVKDVTKATDFYTKTLGLKTIPEMSQPGVFTPFALNGGAMFGVFNAVEIPSITQPYEIAFEVDDVDAVYRQWKAAGVDIVSEPHDMPFGRTFHIRTPDGHILRAYKSVPTR
ncbi:MAG: VOC family protein [Armatimonadota bacterium]